MTLLATWSLAFALALGILPQGGSFSDPAATTLNWVWPLAASQLIRPFAAPVEMWGAGHRGIDLLARSDEPVNAVAAGRVVFVGSIAGRPVISILHQQGALSIRSTYEPVAATISAGDLVAAGQQIGLIATGGHCSERCLHLGLKTSTALGDTYLDPLSFLQRSPASLKPTRLSGPLDGPENKPFEDAPPRHGYSAGS